MSKPVASEDFRSKCRKTARRKGRPGHRRFARHRRGNRQGACRSGRRRRHQLFRISRQGRCRRQGHRGQRRARWRLQGRSGRDQAGRGPGRVGRQGVSAGSTSSSTMPACSPARRQMHEHADTGRAREVVRRECRWRQLPRCARRSGVHAVMAAASSPSGPSRRDSRPCPVSPTTRATKAAVAAYTRGWARDLGPKGITVNNVQPGPIDTDMAPKEGPLDELLRTGTALGRYGKPEEVAAAVAFLASPARRLYHRHIAQRGWRLRAHSRAWARQVRGEASHPLRLDLLDQLVTSNSLSSNL